MEESGTKTSLRMSILGTTALYFILQCLVFMAFALKAGFFGLYWIPFGLTSFLFHALLYSLMLLFIEDFRKESDGVLLASINLANRITLFRVSTLPTLLYLVIAAKRFHIRYPLLILVVCIFATDFLDGYVSRKGKEVTKVGRMMDSASDYSLLIVLSVVFRYYKIIPAWFLILVLLRLGIQTLLMALLITVKKRIEPTSTIMGKVAVASIMIVYSLELLILLIDSVPKPIKNGVEWAAAAILIASIGDKILSFAREVSRVGPTGRISNGNDKERS
ncbi:MAG: CDP-alcohol phosphatidyltransferase family protein [Spirochaetia bacterium]|jgi:phosphatidylglycerophosphate synthase|nr:CDP-alcohol phosphatidyltransferase family protein [Spirochaetales bacterium]MDX9784019.1 CDP-alcohol phosphatidyltransferase family protein [Spirochaetia bacterium]